MANARFSIRKLIMLLSFLSSAACSGLLEQSTGNPELDALQKQPLYLDLFSARGFLGGSEYERYFLKDDFLWRECGAVNPNQAIAEPSSLDGNQFLEADPTLKIEQRRVENLSSDQRLLMKQRTLELIRSIGESSPKKSLPPPGSYFALSDPGIFELQLTLGEKRHLVVTSVDAVAEKESDSLQKAHELFQLLRSIGPEICGSSTFFGIARLN